MLRCVLTCALSVFACFSLWAEEGLFLGVEKSRIERVLAMGYNLDPGTEAEISRIAQEFPGSPVGPMMEAGYLYWMQKYIEWDEGLKLRFEERSEEALEFAKAYLEDRRTDPDARFAVAMIELMQVIYYVDHHRWWAAFWKSGSSLKTMRRLVAEYPDYHDAKLPLGMQNCYLSKTPGYLKPLAFLMRFKGDWDLGLRYMREARDGGLFCKVDAGYYLAAIRIELEGDRQASRDEMAKLVEAFPGNLKFQAMLAELDRSVGDVEAARERASSVLADQRVQSFAALKGRTLATLLWSALASERFELAIRTSEELEVFLGKHPRGASSKEWAAFVRAEASLGLGRREEAERLWKVVSEGEDPAAADAARERLLSEVRD